MGPAHEGRRHTEAGVVILPVRHFLIFSPPHLLISPLQEPS